jgi:hypothetical protein
MVPVGPDRQVGEAGRDALHQARRPTVRALVAEPEEAVAPEPPDRAIETGDDVPDEDVKRPWAVLERSRIPSLATRWTPGSTSSVTRSTPGSKSGASSAAAAVMGMAVAAASTTVARETTVFTGLSSVGVTATLPSVASARPRTRHSQQAVEGCR